MMSDSDAAVLAARAGRNRARGALDDRVTQVKADLVARSVAERMVDKVSAEAKEIVTETVDVARQSTGIIAGTIAAVTLWMFRRPLQSLIREWLDQ
jgi:hypothetical protein